MKKIISVAAVLALAACNGAEAPAGEEDTAATEESASDILEGDAPGFEAVAPGTYEVTRPEGQVDYVEIHDGLTFSRVDSDGNATGGVIFMKNGETCFLVEGDEEENCFTDGPMQEDGTMETTAGDGGVSTVRAVDGTLADYVGDGE